MAMNVTGRPGRSSGNTDSTAAQARCRPMPGRRITGLPFPSVAAVKLASTTAMASPWPISASTFSSSGLSRGSIPLSMGQFRQLAWVLRARHHGNGVGHADMLGVDDGNALAQPLYMDAVGDFEDV